MATNDEGWTRAELARWFIDHDEVDEAASALQPGDELAMGRSDSLNLAAALARRGLWATYDTGRIRVRAADELAGGGGLAGSPRKPPARVTPSAAPAAAKKTA